MRILEYLQSFGEEALKKGTALFSLTDSVQQVVEDAENSIAERTSQVYLLTASGGYLDRWGAELAGLTRVPLEADENFRTRIILALFRTKGTRRAVRDAIELVTGSPPIEIFEPIRDTAYWNAGFFPVRRPEQDIRVFMTFFNDGFYDANQLHLHRDDRPLLQAALRMPVSGNISAAPDGTGKYCARFGTKADSSYIGYVKVFMPSDEVGGERLTFYDRQGYREAFNFIASAKCKTNTQEDVVRTVHEVIPAGANVFIEFIQ